MIASKEHIYKTINDISIISFGQSIIIPKGTEVDIKHLNKSIHTVYSISINRVDCLLEIIIPSIYVNSFKII